MPSHGLLWVSFGCLACLALGGGLMAPSLQTDSPGIPIGISVLVPIPEQNPWTWEKAELGRRLFFDQGLSRDGSISCASCHNVERAFTDGNAKPFGVDAQQGRRNVPSLVNCAFQKSLFWDGRRASLEEQALDPIENPTELGNNLGRAIHFLESEAEYAAMFEQAFGTPRVTSQRIAKAIASYERTLFSGNTPFDRYSILGDESALTAAALRGLNLFMGRARCSHCHEPPLFTDHRFHNTGVSWGMRPLDLGRYEHSGQPEDKGKFKVPSLRDVSLTAPYMHDGSMATLEEVIEFYSRGSNSNPNLDQTLQPLNLTPSDKTDLVVFLNSLTM